MKLLLGIQYISGPRDRKEWVLPQDVSFPLSPVNIYLWEIEQYAFSLVLRCPFYHKLKVPTISGSLGRWGKRQYLG